MEVGRRAQKEQRTRRPWAGKDRSEHREVEGQQTLDSAPRESGRDGRRWVSPCLLGRGKDFGSQQNSKGFERG